MKSLLVTIFALMTTQTVFAGQTGSGGDEIPQMVTLHCYSINIKQANGKPKFWIDISQAKDFGSRAVLTVHDLEALAAHDWERSRPYQTSKAVPEGTINQSVTFMKDHFELVLRNDSIQLNVNLNTQLKSEYPNIFLVLGKGSLKIQGNTVFENESFSCRPGAVGDLKD